MCMATRTLPKLAKHLPYTDLNLDIVMQQRHGVRCLSKVKTANSTRTYRVIYNKANKLGDFKM